MNDNTPPRNADQHADADAIKEQLQQALTALRVARKLIAIRKPGALEASYNIIGALQSEMIRIEAAYTEDLGNDR